MASNLHILETDDDRSLREALTSRGRYRVLRLAEPEITTRAAVQATHPDADLRQALIVDAEATGLNPDEAHILSLSALPVWYDCQDLDILGVGACETWFHDPGVEIPQAITDLTGIDKDTVTGHDITERLSEINARVDASDICIAHNAAYDRPLCSRYVDSMINKPWACSWAGVPWDEIGYISAKLPHLLADIGYFYHAHRSESDVFATAVLLAHNGSQAFQGMIARARERSYTIRIKLPFAKNEDIKAIGGYRFDGQSKEWHKTLVPAAGDQSLPDELAALRAAIGRVSAFPSVEIGTARTRYASRAAHIFMAPGQVEAMFQPPPAALPTSPPQTQTSRPMPAP